jgi:hypothetical protein
MARSTFSGAQIPEYQEGIAPENIGSGVNIIELEHDRHVSELQLSLANDPFGARYSGVGRSTQHLKIPKPKHPSMQF